MSLDEQTQIDMLRGEIDTISNSVQVITLLLVGDKMKVPNEKSLIDDIIENTAFRKSVNKKLNIMITAFIGGSLAILTKAFWIKLFGIGE